MRKAKRIVYQALGRFTQAEEGATAIEYGLIAAGVSIAIVIVVFALGQELENTFTNVVNCLQGNCP